MEKFLEIGKIVNTRGLDGTLKISPLTDDIKRFLKLKKVYMDNISFKVLKASVSGNFAYLKLENVSGVENAQKFKEKYVLVDRENAVELKKDEYFIADLIGLNVLTDDGINLGILTDIDNFGSKDIYTIKGKKEHTFCLIENLILSVDDEKIILNSKILKEVLVWE